MKPLIVDPHDYSAEQAAETAEEIAHAFCEANRMPFAHVTTRDCRGYRGYYRAHKIRVGALRSWQGYVYYDPSRCVAPVTTPGYKWSYTGYKADNTVAGVIAHEIGHHTWECRVRMEDGRRHSWTAKSLADYWAEHSAKEASVTSYGDTSTEEDFAETVKIFVLNPDLLRQGRPWRWSMLTDGFGLRPVVDTPWEEVLRNAHERLLAAAVGWIHKGRAE